MTQPALAARVGVSVPTLRQAERGRGTLSGFVTLATALGLELDGRSLPPGKDLGARLATMRARRGWSRRDVSGMAGVSPTTLAALEHGGKGHLGTAVRIGEALGVRLCLRPVGTRPPFWEATGTSSAHHGWTTPADVLERLYRVVDGCFDLDPCSPSRKGPVRARLHYTAEQDGLALPWRGFVFPNPPYGRTLGTWVAKARAEVETGRAAAAIALIPARTDTRWWHDHIAGRADTWMLRGRLAFGDGKQAAPFPSAIVAWGVSEQHRMRLDAAFPDAWHVRS